MYGHRLSITSVTACRYSGWPGLSSATWARKAWADWYFIGGGGGRGREGAAGRLRKICERTYFAGSRGGARIACPVCACDARARQRGRRCRVQRCGASAPAQEQRVELAQRDLAPGRAAVVALVGAIGRFHLAQQRVHFIERQAPVRAHRAVAGHRRSEE